MRDLADELLQAKVKAKLFGGDHAPRLGRLIILDRLGAGAMGTVYSAYDPRLDRRVAVKVMHAADEAANARFLRECRALAKLAHPNIVTIHDAGEDAGAVHVVMELATGVPLRAWIDNKDRTWRDVVRVMSEVAAGLAAAHRAGIVHRDVKPDNILVGDRARLIDFGLAHAPSSKPDQTSIAPANGSPIGPLADTAPRRAPTDESLAATAAASIDDRVAGTPSYMAPEVLAGGDATAAADQFSMAVTMFEALYGTRPHTGTTRAELREAALHAADGIKSRRSSVATRPPEKAKSINATIDQRSGRGIPARRASETVPSDRTSTSFERQAPAVTGVPAWIDALLKRALAAKPEDRFPSVDAFAAELTRDRRRRRVLIATVATALAAGGAIGALAYRAGGEPRVVPEVVSCDGHARVEAVWNDKRTVNVRSELGDVPWAGSTLDALGRSARDWESSFKKVCEATRISGEQSDRLLELRSRCLDRALDRFGALVDAMIAPLDEGARAEAPSSIAALPSPARCESLTDDAELVLPTDPAKRSEITAIERELDHAWAAYSLGRYLAARTRATALSERASKIDASALHAAILLLGAAIEGRTGDGPRARRLLDAAAVLAAKAKAPELEYAVSARMLRQELFAGHYDRVLEWASIGTAAAARAGHDGGEIEGVVGEAARQAGKLGDAREHLAAALASRDPMREDARALVEMNLGSIDLALGKSQTAELQYQRALDHSRRALGEGHPTLAIHIDRLAESARARGKLKAAFELHDRSQELRHRAFGDDDRSLATARFHRAETLLEAGRVDDAATEAAAARSIREKAWGKHSERLGEIDSLLGDIALARGKLADARATYDHAVELDDDITTDHRLTALVLGATGPIDRSRLAAAVSAVLPAATAADLLEPKRLAREATVIEPFTIDRTCAIAVKVALLPEAQAAPIRTALLGRYRAAGPVDAGLSIAVGDMLFAAGDKATAATVYSAALAATSDEPSRLRLHAYRGLAASSAGDGAKVAAAAADALAAAMPQLR